MQPQHPLYPQAHQLCALCVCVCEGRCLRSALNGDLGHAGTVGLCKIGSEFGDVLIFPLYLVQQ